MVKGVETRPHRLELMGHFKLVDGAGVSPHVYSVKVRALLVCLAVASPARLSREHLISLLWPRYRRASALTSLRKALHELRRSLPHLQGLHASRQEIWLEQYPSELACDWWEAQVYLKAVGAHDHADIDQCGPCQSHIHLLRERLAGEVCPDLTVDEPGGFDGWKLGRSGRLRDQLDRLIRSERARRAYASLGNIPASEAPLFGRDCLLGELEEFVRGGAAPIVSLVGMGGVGKSHLARVLARRRAEGFPDGIWLLSLSQASLPQPLSQGGPVQAGWMVSLVAVLVGVTLGADRSQTLERLRHHKCLIILDEFEHCLGERGAQLHGAREVEALLAGMPECQFVVTTRRSLGVEGPEVWVGGLDYPLEAGPSEAPLGSYPSVALFAEIRGRRLDLPPLNPEELELAGDICRRLGGHPLGIKLAGVLSQEVPLPELYTRLQTDAIDLSSPYRGTLPRHQDLDDLLGETLTGLTPSMVLLLRALCLWEGPILSADVEAVVEGLLPEAWVAPALAELSERCLLEPGPAKSYGLHALLRDAVGKRIPQWMKSFSWDPELTQGLQKARERHFLGRLYAAYPRLLQGEVTLRRGVWMTMGDTLQCWEHCLKEGRFDLLVEAIPGLILVTHDNGAILDTLDRLISLREHLALRNEPLLEAKASLGLGIAYSFLSRSKETVAVLESISPELLAPWERAHRAAILGSQLLYVGESEAGLALLEGCLEGPEPKKPLEAHARALALNITGMWKARTGTPGGMAHLEEGLALSRRYKLREREAKLRTNISGINSIEGDLEPALAQLVEARKVVDAFELRSIRLSILQALGYVYLEMGDNEKGLKAYDDALKSAKALALPNVVVHCLHGRAYALYCLDDYAAAAMTLERCLQLRDDGFNPLVVARIHLLLGVMQGLLGDPAAMESAARAHQMAKEASFWPTQCGAEALRVSWGIRQGDDELVANGTKELLYWMDLHPGLPVPNGFEWAFNCYEGLVYLGDERCTAHLEALKEQVKHQLLQLRSRTRRRILAKGSPGIRMIIEALRANTQGDVDADLGLH